jgi:ABC-type Fe3+ transport system substrate-binding protein
VIPNVLVLLANAPNPEQGKEFINFLVRPEIQKLLASGDAGQKADRLETSVGGAIPSLDTVKPLEVDNGKLVSKTKELSQGFLKNGSRKKNDFLHRSRV